MAQYDLTHEISQCLDRHLVFPLFQFLELKSIYQVDDLKKCKMELLSATNMVDFAMDIYKDLYQTDVGPSSLIEKREQVLKKLKSLQFECQPIIDLLTNVDILKQLRQDKVYNMQFLQENYGLNPNSLDTLYEFAKFQFDCGNYNGAAECLCHFRILSTDVEKNFGALWGKFASEILMQNWEGALEDMNRLKELIDSKNYSSPLQLLQQRTWLIHWSLFVFFNHPQGGDAIIDMFFQPQYINTIQTTCPHILRYLTTAVITNKRRRNVLKDLVKVIKQEGYTYRDPITQFLECLYVNFDFDVAQQ
eukprot:Sdes_comp14829_c0_seq1m3586